MDLSQRKKNILKAVVSENIKTAEPVSSAELAREYLSDISSATIRNELAALEEMGYLVQPHTSSGRVPTLQGFKKYIEELMPEQKLSKHESDRIRGEIAGRMNNISDIVEKTAEVISNASNYASVVSFGLSDNAVIEKLIIMPTALSKALVVVVTDIGTIKETIDTHGIVDSELGSAEKFCQDRLVGKTLGTIHELQQMLPDEIQKYKILFDAVLEVISEKSDSDSSAMAVRGREKLLDYPEYQDAQKFKQTLKTLGNKEKLKSIIDDDSELEISIKIGTDDETGIENSSVVTAKYKVNGKIAGTASVVGPVRMDYARVISILKDVTKNLEDNIGN